MEEVSDQKPRGVLGFAVIFTILTLFGFLLGTLGSAEYLQSNSDIISLGILLLLLIFSVVSWYITFRAALGYANSPSILRIFKITALTLLAALFVFGFIIAPLMGIN